MKKFQQVFNLFQSVVAAKPQQAKALPEFLAHPKVTDELAQACEVKVVAVITPARAKVRGFTRVGWVLLQSLQRKAAQDPEVMGKFPGRFCVPDFRWDVVIVAPRDLVKDDAPEAVQSVFFGKN